METTTLDLEVQSYIQSHRFRIMLHLFEKNGNVNLSFFKSNKTSPFRKPWKQLNLNEIKYFVNKVRLTIDNLPVPESGDGLQSLNLEEDITNEESTSADNTNKESTKRKIKYIDPDSQQGKDLKKRSLEQKKHNEKKIKERNEEKKKQNEKEETQKMNYVKLKELIAKNDPVELFSKALSKDC